MNTNPIEINAGNTVLHGDLTIPEHAEALIIFAHGSGSSRTSRRNQFVARVLQEAGLATLLFDLLSESEEEVDSFYGHLRFDIPFLADRLGVATEWARRRPEFHDLRIGYFGASTGAAAALMAATRHAPPVGAVVSRGGRPDLAGNALRQMTLPTLLIVGGNDDVVIDLNEEALAHLRGDKDLVIVPGATHLFEEPGALEQVATLARDWFLKYLTRVHA